MTDKGTWEAFGDTSRIPTPYPTWFDAKLKLSYFSPLWDSRASYKRCYSDRSGSIYRPRAGGVVTRHATHLFLKWRFQSKGFSEERKHSTNSHRPINESKGSDRNLDTNIPLWTVSLVQSNRSTQWQIGCNISFLITKTFFTTLPTHITLTDTVPSDWWRSQRSKNSKAYK